MSLSLDNLDALQSNDEFKINIISQKDTLPTNTKIKVAPYDQFFPIVQSNESIHLNIKNFFVLLNNIHLLTHQYQSLPKFKCPCLIMTITYKDQHQNSFSEKYKMKLEVEQQKDSHSNPSGLIIFNQLK